MQFEAVNSLLNLALIVRSDVRSEMYCNFWSVMVQLTRQPDFELDTISQAISRDVPILPE